MKQSAKEAAIRAEMHQLLDSSITKMMSKTGYQKDGHFPTFTERELLASSVGEELSARLLEKNLFADEEFMKLRDADVCPCPKCKTLSSRIQKEDGGCQMEKVLINTKVGKITFSAPIFLCEKCRRKFSPLRAFVKSRFY
jgi:hypothetical protein